VRADGTGKRILVRNGSIPSWSPRGDLIAFSRDRDAGGRHLGRERTGNDERRLTTSPQVDIHPAWAPAEGIAFTRLPDGDPEAGQIFVIDPDGTNERRLTRVGGGSVRGGSVGGGLTVGFLSWSPNGSKLAFSDGGVAVVDANGGTQEYVSTEIDDEAPGWEPVQGER
jgi:Tol biopolymer transport system component